MPVVPTLPPSSCARTDTHAHSRVTFPAWMPSWLTFPLRSELPSRPAFLAVGLLCGKTDSTMAWHNYWNPIIPRSGHLQIPNYSRCVGMRRHQVLVQLMESYYSQVWFNTRIPNDSRSVAKPAPPGSGAVNGISLFQGLGQPLESRIIPVVRESGSTGLWLNHWSWQCCCFSCFPPVGGWPFPRPGHSAAHVGGPAC